MGRRDSSLTHGGRDPLVRSPLNGGFVHTSCPEAVWVSSSGPSRSVRPSFCWESPAVDVSLSLEPHPPPFRTQWVTKGLDPFPRKRDAEKGRRRLYHDALWRGPARVSSEE